MTRQNCYVRESRREVYVTSWIYSAKTQPSVLQFTQPFEGKMKNVAVIYHYVVHYRRPIFNLLSRSESPEYTIVSGHDSEIVIKKLPSSYKDIPPTDGGIRWKFVKNYWFLNRFLFQPGIFKYSLSKDVDTIIFLGNPYFISTWISAVLARIAGKKVVIWSHGFLRPENNLKGLIRATFLNLAHEHLVYGGYAKKNMVKRGFKPDKIHLVYNSLDYDNQRALRESPRPPSLSLFDSNVPVFGFIGRLTKQKKIDILLDVLARLNEGKHRANLLIVGDGEERANLEKKVEELGLSQSVYFYGACYDEEMIRRLVLLMNVVVAPGEVGLTAIHALTFGVPVITHNNFNEQMPEFEAITDGQTGSFFDYDDPMNALYATLETWLFEIPKGEKEKDCYRVVDERYNPYHQKKIIDSVV